MNSGLRVYVASSWRNSIQPSVVEAIREADHEVYDFRKPDESDRGFHWSDIDPEWKDWTPSEFREHIEHPIAQDGYDKDFAAMQWANCCVLVMPCGRSAHLEAGWFIGQGKPTLILLHDGEPELMYRMATTLCIDLPQVLVELEKHRPRCAVCGRVGTIPGRKYCLDCAKMPGATLPPGHKLPEGA